MKRLALAILLSLIPSLALAQPDWGVLADGQTYTFLTNTVGTDGVAETLGSEAVAAYPDSSDTQLTDGVSIDDDVDSTTGLHRVSIDTTQTGFTPGSRYTVTYTAGTCDGVSVAGRVIGTFRLTSSSNPPGAAFNETGGRIWFVAASGGSSGNPGTKALPLDTYVNARSACSDGDTIHLMAGTHSIASVGSANTGGKRNIILEGDGWETIWSSTGSLAAALWLGEANWTIRNFKIEFATSTTGIGIYSANEGIGTTIEGMWVRGNNDSINLQAGCHNLVIRRNLFEATWDNVVVEEGRNVIFEDNTCINTCDHASATEHTGIYLPQSGRVCRNTFIMTKTGNNARNLTGLGGTDHGEHLVLDDNVVQITASHASQTGNMYGYALVDDGAGGERGYTIRGGAVRIDDAGSGTNHPVALFDLNNFPAVSEILTATVIGTTYSGTALGAIQKLEADVESTKTRALLALPAVAPAASGGLLEFLTGDAFERLGEPENGDIASDIAEIESSGGGEPISPFLVNKGHSWKFDNPSQVTAPNLITEVAGFDDVLFEMDLTGALANNASVNTIGSITVTNITGTEPTVVSSAKRADSKAIHIKMDGAGATANTYTVNVTFTTTDGQTLVRKGRLVVQ